jgi:PrtD family type I secretion system ABC transporter
VTVSSADAVGSGPLGNGSQVDAKDRKPAAARPRPARSWAGALPSGVRGWLAGKSRADARQVDAGSGRPQNPIAAALAACRSAFWSAASFTGVINILMLASPLFMMQIYDRVLSSRSMPTLAALTLLIAFVFVFVGILEMIRQRLMVRIGAAVDARLREIVFDIVMRRSLERGGAIQGQPLRDLDSLRQFVSGQAPFAIFDLPWMPLYVLINFLLHPWLGVLTLIAMLLLLGLAIANERLTKEAANQAQAAAAKAASLAEEGRRSAEVLRAMGIGASYRDRWNKVYDRSAELQVKAADKASVFMASTKSLRLFMQSAVLALGAMLAIQGYLSAGALIAASILLSRALAPVEQLTGQWTALQNARRSYDRLRQLLEAPDQAKEPMELPAPKGHISVRGLAACAPGGREPLISSVSFDLNPGDGLGVIGPSGSGKSSLVRALVGVFPIMRGTVRIDGATLDQWPAHQLGRAIGYVPQSVEMLSGTVRENISRFAEDADAAAVVRAAQKANVHEMILRLPKGYDTELGEGGSRLSAGQLQRLALARALYGDPVMLILDEPNSNLDSAGEMALNAALKDLREQGVTVIVIAHRRQALQAVDKVLFVTDGRQLDFGQKDEVLERVLEPESNKGNGAARRPNGAQARPTGSFRGPQQQGNGHGAPPPPYGQARPHGPEIRPSQGASLTSWTSLSNVASAPRTGGSDNERT